MACNRDLGYYGSKKGEEHQVFDQTANAYKRYNRIDHTMVHEVSIVELDKIKGEIISFNKLYTQTEE